MNNVKKASDEDIMRLNSAGLSLGTIGKMLGVHPTTITTRLKALGIPVADTRRAFMEDIWLTMTTPQQDWLIQQLGPTMSIRDYVRGILINEYVNRNAGESDV